MKRLTVALLFVSCAGLGGPSDSIQLQQLIIKSQQQLDSLKEILTYEKKDSASSERAAQILNDLSLGISQSIEEYKGTSAYQKALLELQSKPDFSSDAKNVQDNFLDNDQSVTEKRLKDFGTFQQESIKANQQDLTLEQGLQEALQKAQPGFVPKVQAQTELKSWQTNIRISTQLTQLLSTLQAMREEMRVARAKEQGLNLLSQIVEGANRESQKQKGLTNATP